MEGQIRVALGFVRKSEVVCIEIALDILSEASGILLLVSPQERSSLTLQTIIMISIPIKTGSVTLFRCSPASPMKQN